MKTLPINLKLEGLNILMVGGGGMAAEKLEKLLPHRPRLTLVSPEVTPDVRAMIDQHGIHYLPECYRAEHLAGQQLAFGATDDRDVSRRLYADTRGSGVLINAVDLPECCDFIMPAVVSGAHFTLAISTGGMAAGLSRQMREQLESAVRQEDGILELLEKIRTLLKRKVVTFDARRERLWQILRELEVMERRGANEAPPGGGE